MKIKTVKSSKKQTHVHEFELSTMLAEQGQERHNHRFAGVSDEKILVGKSHIHLIQTKTDFFDHFHRIIVFTGPAIPVSKTKHIHLVKGATTLNDGHRHNFIFTTQINSPLLP